MAYSVRVHPIAIGKPVQRQAYRTIILYIQTDPFKGHQIKAMPIFFLIPAMIYLNQLPMDVHYTL